MKRFIVNIALIACIVTGTAALLIANPQDEEAAIRELQAEQANAWNKHNATAYANLFTENGEVVNVVGWWWKGRSEIESKLAAAFAFVFKESVLTITEVHVRLLTPEIAIAHVRWTMTGAKTPPNIPQPREGIQLQVLMKHSNQWLIESFQNTNSLPEMSFPTGPTGHPSNR